MGPSFSLTRGTERESTGLPLRSIFIKISSRNTARNHFFPSLLTQAPHFRDQHHPCCWSTPYLKKGKVSSMYHWKDGIKWLRKKSNTRVNSDAFLWNVGAPTKIHLHLSCLMNWQEGSSYLTRHIPTISKENLVPQLMRKTPSKLRRGSFAKSLPTGEKQNS